MIPRFDQLDLRSTEQVLDVLTGGIEANRTAACREGSIDVVRAGAASPAKLIATGDLHDNPVHLARLVEAAGLYRESADIDEKTGRDCRATQGEETRSDPSHLILHEVIHGGRLVNEMDFSYRALVRIAAIKASHSEHVHVLLANHELSQIVGAGIVKDGLNVVRAFNDAVDFTFGGRADEVHAAIGEFIRSLPLALRCDCIEAEGGVVGRRVLCAHSLPPPELMDRFDPDVLSRELVEDDYVPRRGSAHLMVWGRGHTPEQLTGLAERWGVSLFVLGHEKADDGVLLVEPNAVVLNSDHERGKLIEIDLADPPDARRAAGMARGI